MKPSYERQAEFIKAVKTPLSLFAAVIILVQVLFMVVVRSAGHGPYIWGGLGVVVLIICAVTFLAYARPEALFGARPPVKASTRDPAVLALMTYHSKEALTVIRVESANRKTVSATVAGANERALHFYGFRPNQADQLLGQSTDFLFNRLSQWVSGEDFEAFLEDQDHRFSDLDRGYEVYAKVPMVIDDRHPFTDIRGRRFLPVTIAHSIPKTRRKKRFEDLLVVYFDLDEIARDIRPAEPAAGARVEHLE